jgi:hypothetical protein
MTTLFFCILLYKRYLEREGVLGALKQIGGLFKRKKINYFLYLTVITNAS